MTWKLKRDKQAVRKGMRASRVEKKLKQLPNLKGLGLNVQIPEKKESWKLKEFDGLEEGRKVLNNLGLPEPPKPNDMEFNYPDDTLPDLTYTEISEMLGRLGSLTGYVRWLLACAEAERQHWEWNYIWASEAKILQRYRDNKQEKNKELTGAAVDKIPSIYYRLMRYYRALAYEKYLSGLLESYGHYYEKLSREISTRERQWKEHKRQGA